MIKTLVLFLLFCALWVIFVVSGAKFLYGQSMVQHSGQFNHSVEMFPGAIPTNLTCIVGTATTCRFVLSANASDPYVCSADFTGTGQTITMQDGNTITWIVAGGALGASGAPVGWEWHAASDATCRHFPLGLYLQAGTSGATGSMVVKWN